MFARKTLIGLAIAGMSAGAFAQQSDAGKTDIFGRPYVGLNANEVYYQADPYAPLPQIEALRAKAEAAAGTAEAAAPNDPTDILGRPQLNVTANQVYFEADPFAPLPQLQSMYRSSLVTSSSVASAAGSKADILGRPYAGWDAQGSYYASNPYAPLPQFWNRDVAGLGAVASGPEDTKQAATHAPGSNG